MPLQLPVLLAALCLGATERSPSPRGSEGIEFRWEAPPACPNEVSVRTAIERHVGRPLAEIRDRRLSIIATAHNDESRWSLTIFTVSPDGTRERSLRHSQCILLADAAAVLVALTIDPQVLSRLDPAALELLAGSQIPAAEPTSAPSPAPVATQTSSPPSTEEPIPVQTLEPAPAPAQPPAPAPATSPAAPSPPPRSPTQRRLDPRGAARLASSLGFGDLPSVGGGLGLALALRLRRFQVELTGGTWFLRSIRLDLPGSSGAVFDLWTVALRGGYVVPAGKWFEVPLLLGAEAGQIHVRGVELVGAADTRTPWLAFALAPGLTFVPRPAVAVVLGIDLLVPATRPRFVVEDVGEIFRSQPVAIRAALGVEIRFPNQRIRSR